MCNFFIFHQRFVDFGDLFMVSNSYCTRWRRRYQPKLDKTPTIKRFGLNLFGHLQLIRLQNLQIVVKTNMRILIIIIFQVDQVGYLNLWKIRIVASCKFIMYLCQRFINECNEFIYIFFFSIFLNIWPLWEDIINPIAIYLQIRI